MSRRSPQRLAPTKARETNLQDTRCSGRHRSPRRVTGPERQTVHHRGQRSKETNAYRSPRPHQHPQITRGHLRPRRSHHATSHTKATLPGKERPKSRPAHIDASLGCRGEQVPGRLGARGAPIPQGLGPLPQDQQPPLSVRVCGAWVGSQRAADASTILRGNGRLPGRPEPGINRRRPLLAPTIIIGDLFATQENDVHTGSATATKIPVQDTMQQLGLPYLIARVNSTHRHYPHTGWWPTPPH